jgi:hypothetical protein
LEETVIETRDGIPDAFDLATNIRVVYIVIYVFFLVLNLSFLSYPSSQKPSSTKAVANSGVKMAYHLTTSYAGEALLSGFNWFNGVDPSHGFVS